MNLAELQAIIKGRLRNSKSTQVDSIILSELKLLQTSLEMDSWLPDFLQTSDNTLETTVGTSEVALPLGFIREIHEGGMWLLSDGKRSKEIVKNDFDYLVSRYGVSEGAPEAYAIIGGKFQIFPIPDAVYSIELFFFKQDEVIDGVTVTSNQWTTKAVDLIVGLIGAIIAGQYTADLNAIAQFEAQAQLGRRRLRHYVIANEEANRVRLNNP